MAADDDIYSALVGGAPTDPQRQAMLAAMLRQQAGQGRFLQASGDRVIAPMGAQMEEEAMKGATGIAGEREREAQFRMMQEYRMAQEQNMVDRLSTSLQLQGMKGATAERVAQTHASATVEAAEKRAEGKVKPIPESTRKQLDDARNSIAGVEEATNTYKPGFGGTGRNTANWLAANVPIATTQAQKDAQNWWANYGRQFTLPELKATIGLRHNQYMQGVFESYHLNPNMNDDQITKNLNQIHSQINDRISRSVTALRDQGYDVTGYEGYLAPVQDSVKSAAKSEARGGAAATSGAAPTPATAPSVHPSMNYLQRGSVSGPAYLTNPGAVPPRPTPQPMAPNPLVRPTPPQGNLFQGLGGIPSG